MIRLFIEGGPYMVVLTFLALVVLTLSAKKGFDLFLRPGRRRERLARGLDSILFWGCISAVLGFLGQFTGAYLSLQSIRAAGAVNPPLLAKGIAVSLITSVYGLTILGLSTILWFGLRCRLKRLQSCREE
jgi:hypothetical protein